MTKRICTFSGCTRGHYGKGLCASHYHQSWRGVDLIPLPVKSDSLIEKIERRLDKQPNGCWLWTGAKQRSGYGNVRWGKKFFRVHRAYLIELVVDVPEGMDVDHLCGVRACVNPDHLEVVTHAENVRRVRR